MMKKNIKNLFFVLIAMASVYTGSVQYELFSDSSDSEITLVESEELPVYMAGKFVREYATFSNWKNPENIDYKLGNVYEISNFPGGSIVTNEQAYKANQLRKNSFEYAKKRGWFTYENGIKDGYLLRSKFDPFHYTNEEYLADKDALNYKKPEALMYYPTPKGMILAGVMFLADGVNSAPKQVGGNLMLWHIHKWSDNKYCWKNGLPIGESECKGEGEISSKFTPAMLHVWFVDHPEGMFATNMCLPGEILGEENMMEYILSVNSAREELLRYQETILLQDH